MACFFYMRMKRMSSRHIKSALLPIICAIIFTACGGSSRPSDVMTPLQMADFLTEAYLLEAYNSINHLGTIDTLDPTVAAAYSDLLARQGLTREQVKKSMDYYGHNPDQYEKILGEVLYRLENEQNLEFVE